MSAPVDPSKPPSKVARVMRVLVYTGASDWVEACIATREIKGRREYPCGSISEAVIGDVPEILEYSAIQAEADRVLDRALCPVCGAGKYLDKDKCRGCGGTGLNNQIRDYDETAGELRATLVKEGK